uniref:Uncharacterized protein n=1 Tax=Anguilla anguilla TaxID=7936 RepID=A0A0E9RXI4_ANGAN
MSSRSGLTWISTIGQSLPECLLLICTDERRNRTLITVHL